MSSLSEILLRIADKKSQYDALKPLPEAMKQSFEAASRIELTYHSNAIEGNTLTLAETALVVNEGQNIAGKTLREIYEARNHDRALTYLDSLVSQNILLSESEILALHKIILTDINDDYAGRYRDVSVRIAGSAIVLPNYLTVPMLMSDLVRSFESPDENTLLTAARKKYEFVAIHPFIDCNGRMSRLIWNYFLLRAGYPYVYVDIAERPAYMQALQKMDAGDSTEYFVLMLKAVERSLDVYLNA